MPVKGHILRIEKLSAFDGDGLRTVIFLKGCPLECVWCSTPESQHIKTDFGMSRQKCIGCFACVEACPENALSWDIKSEQFFTDPKKCADCRECVRACPNDARQAWGYIATVDDIYREVEKDSLFYFHSGGGVTLSGGECLMQPRFSSELLERCITHGINTAIETSGAVPWENVEMVLPWTDTVFYDIKHMDPQIHRELTGSDNSRIIENLQQIDASDDKFSLVIRMPLIPGFNDQESHFDALGKLCKRLNRVSELQLLPYHRLGMETYRRLSRPYRLEKLETPTQEKMEKHAVTLRQTGLKVSIGG